MQPSEQLRQNLPVDFDWDRYYDKLHLKDRKEEDREGDNLRLQQVHKHITKAKINLDTCRMQVSKSPRSLADYGSLFPETISTLNSRAHKIS